MSTPGVSSDTNRQLNFAIQELRETEKVYIGKLNSLDDVKIERAKKAYDSVEGMSDAEKAEAKENLDALYKAILDIKEKQKALSQAILNDGPEKWSQPLEALTEVYSNYIILCGKGIAFPPEVDMAIWDIPKSSDLQENKRKESTSEKKSHDDVTVGGPTQGFGLKLSDILAAPYQRATKYPLLAGDCIRGAPEGHLQKKEFQQFLEVSTQVAVSANEAKRVFEQNQGVREIEKLIQDYNSIPTSEKLTKIIEKIIKEIEKIPAEKIVQLLAGADFRKVKDKDVKIINKIIERLNASVLAYSSQIEAKQKDIQKAKEKDKVSLRLDLAKMEADQKGTKTLSDTLKNKVANKKVLKQLDKIASANVKGNKISNDSAWALQELMYAAINKNKQGQPVNIVELIKELAAKKEKREEKQKFLSGLGSIKELNLKATTIEEFMRAGQVAPTPTVSTQPTSAFSAASRTPLTTPTVTSVNPKPQVPRRSGRGTGVGINPAFQRKVQVSTVGLTELKTETPTLTQYSNIMLQVLMTPNISLAEVSNKTVELLEKHSPEEIVKLLSQAHDELKGSKIDDFMRGSAMVLSAMLDKELLLTRDIDGLKEFIDKIKPSEDNKVATTLYNELKGVIAEADDINNLRRQEVDPLKAFSYDLLQAMRRIPVDQKDITHREILSDLNRLALKAVEKQNERPNNLSSEDKEAMLKEILVEFQKSKGLANFDKNIKEMADKLCADRKIKVVSYSGSSPQVQKFDRLEPGRKEISKKEKNHLSKEHKRKGKKIPRHVGDLAAKKAKRESEGRPIEHYGTNVEEGRPKEGSRSKVDYVVTDKTSEQGVGRIVVSKELDEKIKKAEAFLEEKNARELIKENKELKKAMHEHRGERTVQITYDQRGELAATITFSKESKDKHETQITVKLSENDIDQIIKLGEERSRKLSDTAQPVIPETPKEIDELDTLLAQLRGEGPPPPIISPEELQRRLGVSEPQVGLGPVSSPSSLESAVPLAPPLPLSTPQPPSPPTSSTSSTQELEGLMKELDELVPKDKEPSPSRKPKEPEELVAPQGPERTKSVRERIETINKGPQQPESRVAPVLSSERKANPEFKALRDQFNRKGVEQEERKEKRKGVRFGGSDSENK
ncbi:MAG: hypothetical protein JSR17_00915 [Proteobacteria bacterium]|nr:hypothetical protein [Pseudomonadota bacterium]